MKKIISFIFSVALVVGFTSNANAKTLKCQTVLNTKLNDLWLVTLAFFWKDMKVKFNKKEGK